MMNIDDMLRLLELEPQYKTRFTARCIKLGFLKNGESFSDEEVQSILAQKTDYLQLAPYLQASDKLNLLNFAPKRIENEYKLLVRQYAPAVLLPNSHFLINFTPNTYCFSAEHKNLMDMFIEFLLSMFIENYLIEDKVLSNMTATERKLFITSFLDEHFILEKTKKTLKKRFSHPCLADKKIKKKDYYSVPDYSRIFKIPADILHQKIAAGILQNDEKGIHFQVILSAVEQEMFWIGIGDLFPKGFHERFDFNNFLHREKLRCYLEEYGYFGVNRKLPDDILFEYDRKNFVYIHFDDCGFLYKNTESFFYDFGLTSEEIFYKLLSDYSSNYHKTVLYLRTYVKEQFISEVPWSSLVQICRVLLQYPIELFQCTNEDLVKILNTMPYSNAKKQFIRYARFLKQKTKVLYSEVNYSGNSDEENHEGIPAYSYQKFSKFALCLFNEDYIRTHNLLEKALNSSFYTEMWLYCSIHYVCGWRSGSICNQWKYLFLDENKTLLLEFGISDVTPSGIRNGILSGTISNEQYSKIGGYIQQKITLAAEPPNKTAKFHPDTLQIKFTESLRIHFGRLCLIAEYHHLTTGKGYMKDSRAAEYRNRINLRQFFGSEISELFGDENLKHRRLNKSFLQGVNQSGKDLGYGSMVSHMIAAYARNHTNIDTICYYLSDYNLFNETPEYVVWAMFERGVMGVIPFMLLQTVFPETFNQLSLDYQTKLIKSIGVSSYELEVAYASYMPVINTRLEFLKGELAEPKEILLAMYQIGQGSGIGKDKGIFCLKRALGYSCEHPVWESCIANACPYNVFTHDGIPALLDVIKEYAVKHKKTGNEKYRQVLQQIIMPNFYDILSALKQEMSYEEGKMFDTYLEGELKCRLS